MMKAMMFCCLSILAGVLMADEHPVAPRVSITSHPSGAAVSVDGVDRGTTPILLFDLTPGRHHIKYRLAGYLERDRFFDMDEGPYIEKNEVLVEEKGLLLLKTEPAGCNIAIDGVSVGESPRLITHLAAKDTYSVRLTKVGYQPQVITVKFNGREPLVRTETLVPDAGVVHVISDPPGAEVTVNDVVRGKAPVLVRNVPKGRAVVKFRLPGFREEVREIAMRAGDNQTLAASLTALPGTLNLLSVPDGALFYVNDQPYGRSPVVLPNLTPGEYRVRAELAGYGTLTKTVTLENGASAREEFRLSNQMGRLELRTSPAGAQVSLDGHIAGTTTASDPKADLSDIFVIENVMEGDHLLVLKKDGYAETVRHPKVQATKTLKANIRMKRVFLPDVEIVTSRGSYRGVLVDVTPESVQVEVSAGITRSFPRSEIRKMNHLDPAKATQP